MMNRRHALAATTALALMPGPWGSALAQTRKDSVVLGMTLEPPGLDPTAGAASAIAEVTLYNLFETLTRINPDGTVSPLLAERWEVSPDLKTTTFWLRKGVTFHNGEPCTAATVKFAFERAAGANSTNKDKRAFASIQTISVQDPHTLVIVNREPDPDFLFLLGEASAVIVEPKSAASNNTQPVGTGPYRLHGWIKGSSLTLEAFAQHRDAPRLRIKRAQFRFISDPAAQVAALLAGDVDAFPRVTARGVAQFRAHSGFQVLTGGSRAKTILAINNGRKPLDDVRVRRAIAAALDRKAIIAGAGDGYGVPIGSHYTPGAPGYVDTTALNPHDPAKARALLKEAGIKLPLELTLKLPPTPYARQGGEVVAAQLAKVGIHARQENVEWAQWLSAVYTNRNYDITLISHVEPLDLGNYAKPGYYWGYNSPAFNALYDKLRNSASADERRRLLGDAQRMLATDAVNAYLYQPLWVTVANRKLQGLWKDMPIFANDLSALSWT